MRKGGGGGEVLYYKYTSWCQSGQVASILLEYEKLNNMRGEVCQSEELHLKVLWQKSALKIMRQPKNNDIQRQFCSNSVSHSFFFFLHNDNAESATQ